MRKKKERITYIDDGRTIADMSGVSGGFLGKTRPAGVPRSSLKAQFQTFWDAFKMMLLPTLAVCGAICVIFVVITIVFHLAY